MTEDEDRDAYARTADPITSHEAAASVDTTKAEYAVVAALCEHLEGGTTEQLVEWTGFPAWTVSPRMKPLERKEYVVRHGFGRNRSGKRAIIWRLAGQP